MSTSMDLATQKFLSTDWLSLSLPECKQAAVDFMALWDWQEKVPEYTQIVMQMNSQHAIKKFMFNCLRKGLEYKSYGSG